MNKPAALAIGLAACAASAAQADMPVFSATCLSNNIDADRTGTVRFNGMPADVRKFNDNYYEATIEGLTVSITRDGTGRALITFTGSGGANGVCKVLASDVPPPGSVDPLTSTKRVQFAAGTSGADYSATNVPGSSIRYVLGAANGQFLYVDVYAQAPDMTYRIYNPDGSLLLDEVDSGSPYKGQLWQSGDHVVEVINRGAQNAAYSVSFRIE